MVTTAEQLTAGWHFHQAGDLVRAEAAYRQQLQQEPGNAPVWYLLGAVCQARGDLAAATASLEQALRLRPAFPEALNYRGIVAAQQGQLAEAVIRFRQALRLKPTDAEIRTNLGVALARQGQEAVAVALFHAVLQERPDYARARRSLREAQDRLAAAGAAPAEGESYLRLGTALAEEGWLEEACACYEQALRLRPTWAEAHNQLGKLCYDRRQLAEAERHFREAVRLRPDFADAQYNLGVALTDLQRFAEAEASCLAAVRAQPERAAAHNALGVALFEQQRLAEAVACFRRAVELKPDYALAHNNLGLACAQSGQFEEALASFSRAIQLQPEFAGAHHNRALIKLLLGDYDEGWSEYQWRRRRPGVPPRGFDQPLWDGAPLAGRAILLHAEAGLGDTIQFVRCARLLKEQGATVIVECQKPLLSLLSRCPGIDRLVGQGDPLPPFDVYLPLLDLPHRLRISPNTIPADVPYLGADPALVEAWRRELAALPGFKIGINWQGSGGETDPRSVPLTAFAPLAAVAGVRLVSLQKGVGSQQVKAVAGRWPLTDLSARLEDFTDTAAVMANLDLVITTDTSVPHLAGALGVPVWVALPHVACWRWLLGREDSPWYPTMRLFRQERRGDWGPVFQRMAQAVQQRLGAAENKGTGPRSSLGRVPERAESETRTR